MEMGTVQLKQNGDCIEDTSMEEILSPDSSDAYNVFGEPELFPRVGDQYQVEIPTLVTEAEYLLYKKNPFEVELLPVVSCDFLLGLAIPIIWMQKEVKYMKHEGPELFGDSNGTSNENGLFKCESNKEAQICSQDEDSIAGVEPLNLAMEQDSKSKMHQKNRGEKFCLVPGHFDGSWSDIEEASFLLGLYIFGKNLVQVKKFIENKTMGDIQSYYYGKFYRSDEYRRWSDCRKMKSRRCVYGQRIFTGLRQQELLSRLFLQVSEECQNTLLEVSKTFGDGKMLLEEYVSTLKAIVGMKSLVEAVGIGKGKRDLTSINLEPLKSNQVVPNRPEIPIGKACSSLTPKEIIKFLTGDFRLSKARSNDLFWEAVWPRLLARGWHSEQPKDQVYAIGSKHSLVFLMPGIKKFSRRRLAKGKHYFDSISDVLSKVASDPDLLELDSEADESNRNKEENGRNDDAKPEQDDLSDRRRPCYLQPRTPNRNIDLVKFTVVDTSLADGKTFKVRELRTLPNEISKKTISRSDTEGSDEDSSKVSSEDSEYDREEAYASNLKSADSMAAVVIDNKDLRIGALNEEVRGPDCVNASVKNTNLKQPRKSLKCSQGMKQNNLNHPAPVTKRRRRLSACSRAEASHHLGFSAGHGLEQDKPVCCSDTTDSSERRVSSTSSSKESHMESGEGASCNTNFGSGSLNDHIPHPRTLIDLNLPQVSPDFETSEVSVAGLPDQQEDDQKRKLGYSIAQKPAPEVTLSAFPERQPNVNARRQSTRNRPPTARALEALASGFLTTNSRRRKNKEAGPGEVSTSRPAKRARGTEPVAPQMKEVGNGESNVVNDAFGKIEVLTEGNSAHVTGPYTSVL